MRWRDRTDVRARLVLVTVVVTCTVALAGCSSQDAGQLSMTPVDDAALADRASRDLPNEEGERNKLLAVVRDALRNGSATINETHPPFDFEQPIAYGGAYYNVSFGVVGTTPGYAVDIEVNFNESAAHGSSIAVSDLPTVDRRRLRPLLEGDRSNDQEGYDIGLRATYSATEAARSVFAGTQEYDAIRYHGSTYPVRVEDNEHVTLTTYRYVATGVAGSATEFASRLRDRYAFTLSGLSANETDVVEKAQGGTYRANGTDDAAFRSVLQRFRDRPAVVSEGDHGSWIARYEGQLYWVEIEYPGFVTDSPSVTPPAVTPPPQG